jgi:hypothetical protein
MHVQMLLSEIKELGVTVSLDASGAKIDLHGPPAVLPAVVERIRPYRSLIRDHLLAQKDNDADVTVEQHALTALTHLVRWFAGHNVDRHLEHARGALTMAAELAAIRGEATCRAPVCFQMREIPAPEEQVNAMSSTLTMPGTGISWNAEQISRLKNRLHPGDRIIRVDPGLAVIVERADGSCFAIHRTDA